MTDSPPGRRRGDPCGTAAYTPLEQRSLLGEVARGATAPPCPRCSVSCTVIRTPPRADVSYVRDRVVVRCGACRRSVAAEAGELVP